MVGRPAGTISGIQGWGLGSVAAVTNLTVDSAGNMFGWWDPSQDDLLSINTSTGIATRVGESGVGTAGNGLAFDSTDTLWLEQNNLYTVDVSTGAATFSTSASIFGSHGIFDLSTDLYWSIGGLAINMFDTGTGALSGSLSLVGSPTGLRTLAFATPASVPEPATLALFGIGLAGMGFARKKRKSA